MCVRESYWEEREREREEEEEEEEEEEDEVGEKPALFPTTLSHRARGPPLVPWAYPTHRRVNALNSLRELARCAGECIGNASGITARNATRDDLDEGLVRAERLQIRRDERHGERDAGLKRGVRGGEHAGR